MWASPSLSVRHSRIFFHHLPSHTLKLPSYITHHKLIREVSTLNKIIFPTGYKDILEELLFLKSAKKFLQRKSKLKVCKSGARQNVAESMKNRTTGSTEFFRGTSATQIKKLRTYEISQLYRACCKKSDKKDDLIFYS